MGYKPGLSVSFNYQQNLASAIVMQAKNDYPQRYPKRGGDIIGAIVLGASVIWALLHIS